MKLKCNGFDLELTVEELKQMVEKGLIDSNDEKVPYPDTWEDLLKKIAERPTQPLQPSDPFTPYVNPQSPFPFPTIIAYGCESVQGPPGWRCAMGRDYRTGWKAYKRRRERCHPLGWLMRAAECN